MDILNRWVRHSSPLVKITMAIAVSSAAVVWLKVFYSPHTKKKRLERAEAWANSLIEQEEKMAMASEDL